MGKRKPGSARSREGVATLEFVMVFPLLTFLMIAIIWLGYFCAGQASVTISARNDAWRMRHGSGSGASGAAQGESPFNFATSNRWTKDATSTVNVSAVFDSIAQPKSHHTITGGSWDHNAVDMNRPPNWALYAKVGASAKTANVQSKMPDGLFSSGLNADANTAIDLALDYIGGQKVLGKEISDLLKPLEDIFKRLK
ncbi:pilus assembly protein [Blastopirellula sp. JC732]|uniref:Pilus assembly protein n=1 Tax=Blastopirellula sediminis TaxID=2894196 RepID=A0A9X1MK61_9BACT|nr:TadE family protein [Blastopirellula sediminis]MCC9628638.1 pilus assembly protein [Blastopirellula sediminis]